MHPLLDMVLQRRAPGLLTLCAVPVEGAPPPAA